MRNKLQKAVEVIAASGRFAPKRMPSKNTTGTKPGKRATKPPKWVLHELWLEKYGDEYQAALFHNVKKHLPELEALEAEALARWPKRHGLPFHSGYFEQCYQLQPLIQKIAETLQQLLPERPMRKYFCKVVAEGTGCRPEPTNWEQTTKDERAILDAFHRAYCYLTMACEAGRAVELPGKRPPHWWTTLLYVFELS